MAHRGLELSGDPRDDVSGRHRRGHRQRSRPLAELGDQGSGQAAGVEVIADPEVVGSGPAVPWQAVVEIGAAHADLRDVLGGRDIGHEIVGGDEG